MQNITVSGDRCFNATQTLTIAGNATTFTVQNGGSATLIAGQNILFNPSVSVAPGGYLHAYIAPSGPYCTVPAMTSAIAGETEIAMKPDRHFFSIYPNPTTGTFTLELNGYLPFEKTSVTIYSMNGKKILSSVMTDDIKQDFSISAWPPGIYLVRVAGEKNAGTVKLIKR